MLVSFFESLSLCKQQLTVVVIKPMFCCISGSNYPFVRATNYSRRSRMGLAPSNTIIQGKREPRPIQGDL